MGNQGDLLINDGQIKRTTETGRLFLPNITEPDGQNPMHRIVITYGSRGRHGPGCLVPYLGGAPNFEAIFLLL